MVLEKKKKITIDCDITENGERQNDESSILEKNKSLKNNNMSGANVIVSCKTKEQQYVINKHQRIPKGTIKNGQLS